LKRDYLLKKKIEEKIEKSLKFCNGKLLDIGCGNKPYLDLFLGFVDEYVGLEHPSQKKRFGKAVEIYADCLNLPFAENTFDTIICFEVLEHLEDPFLFFGQVYKALKPGGYLLLSVPQTYQLHDKADYFRFTSEGLKLLCKKSGLRVVKIMPIGNFLMRVAVKTNYFFTTSPWKPLGLFFIPLINIVFDKISRDSSLEPCNNFLIARK